MTFNADEGQIINSLPVNIRIIDDDIDESDDEYFIVHLQLDSATDTDKINITHTGSTGIIRDDDCKSDSSNLLC